MRKILAIWFLVAMTFSQAQEPTFYVIDEVTTARAPWKVGDVVMRYTTPFLNDYRVFLGITTKGYYAVQDFDGMRGDAN